MKGRKRYLPNINSANSYTSAACERQAVNSTVQGSAADLVKKAMIDIHQKLIKAFPKCKNPIRENGCIEEGAHFILQLHDELYYEVLATDLKEVAKIVKEGMENAMKLSVHFPVSVKIGPSWGEMCNMQV